MIISVPKSKNLLQSSLVSSRHSAPSKRGGSFSILAPLEAFPSIARGLFSTHFGTMVSSPLPTLTGPLPPMFPLIRDSMEKLLLPPPPALASESPPRSRSSSEDMFKIETEGKETKSPTAPTAFRAYGSEAVVEKKGEVGRACNGSSSVPSFFAFSMIARAFSFPNPFSLFFRPAPIPLCSSQVILE